MQTILHNCCGVDIHKDTVVACILKTCETVDSQDFRRKHG